LLAELLRSNSPELRAWAIRIVGDQHPDHAELTKQSLELAQDSDLRVRLQVAIAAPKMAGKAVSARRVVQSELDVLSDSADDPILPRVVWQNLLPFADEYKGEVERAIEDGMARPKDTLRDMAPRFSEKWVAGIPRALSEKQDRETAQSILRLAANLSKAYPDISAGIVQPLATRVRNRELDLNAIQPIYAEFLKSLPASQRDEKQPKSRWDQEVLVARLVLGDKAAFSIAQSMIQDRLLDAGMRGKLLRFAAMHPNSVASETLTEVLKDLTNNVPIDNAFRDAALDLGITSATNDDIQRLKAALPKLKIEFQASIAERMCQREPSASALLGLVADGTLRKELLSPNRVRLLAATGSADAKSLVTKIWGTVNAESSREREEVIRRVADELRWDARGSAERGWLVYDRICGQCHPMHGRGVEVGPNITANGRGSHEQLLVSVFNPSLVIGEAYRSVTIRTDDGTVITGLLVSREDDKTVVKIQGGKEVTVPAAEIEVFQQDKKSLMPEGIENQLNEQELADLFALLTLEKAPGSPDNATIQGTPQYLHQPKK
jgi:putative heme-binding domain-containing protein